MKLLLITRKYPPIAGGMERYSEDLYESLKQIIDVDLWANKRGNKFLPLFLLATMFKLLISARKYSHIHLADGLLAPLVHVLKIVTRSRVSITIHGLDVTFENKLYQSLVVPSIKSISKVICVSENTKQECMKRGIRDDQCVVIPNGVRFASLYQKKKICEDLVIKEKKILFSIGRLVERKGIAWFVENVLPRLSKEFVLVVAGQGPEKDKIINSIQKFDLDDRVLMLGRITDEEKNYLYSVSYAFVMPNIPVQGDVEGFGITLIESASRGLFSFASSIDGIPSAVISNKTGILIDPMNSEEFVRAIQKKMIPDSNQIIEAIKKNFDWTFLARRYVEVLQ